MPQYLPESSFKAHILKTQPEKNGTLLEFCPDGNCLPKELAMCDYRKMV